MMRLLPTLKGQDIDGVRRVSLGTAAILFSGINVSIFSVFKPSGPLGIITAVAVSALSLDAITRLIQRALLLAWAAPVLGRWSYESSSGTWGLATISIRGGDLYYEVQLYKTQAHTAAAIRGEPGFVNKCFATVSSVGVTYGHGKMELTYKVDHAHTDYPLRSGMLTLTPLSRDAMKGYWRSDIEGSEPRRGILNMTRVV